MLRTLHNLQDQFSWDPFGLGQGNGARAKTGGGWTSREPSPPTTHSHSSLSLPY